ncbi:glycerol-3-phosphate-binding periplasmic protein precursor [Bordetella pertussis]|nr:glycerol-3-phosphate-binding periplasmic protein precursor [Bordetella pertussis]
MITGSSGLRANIAKNAKFEFGTSTLPYYSDVQGAPQNTIIGGASLWVFANKKPETYKGVTKFFKFLASPEIAARWHQQTGYVPVTKAAYELTQKQGFYDKNPGTDVGVKQLNVETTAQSRACAWATCRRSARSRTPRSNASSRQGAGQGRPAEHRQARQRAAGEVREKCKVAGFSPAPGGLAHDASCAAANGP